jgi:hypothetical protein
MLPQAVPSIQCPIDLKHPEKEANKCHTLIPHQLIDDLERRSSVIGCMALAETPDSRLSDDVGVFANQEHEKDLITEAVEYLVTQASLNLAATKRMLEAVLDENKFCGASTIIESISRDLLLEKAQYKSLSSLSSPQPLLRI